MIHLKEAVIVEGKYDRIKLSGLIDAPIIETGGFSVFADREKLSLIRRLAKLRGIVILTDSDRAGFRIRDFISGSVPPDRIRHVFIPDIMGCERRKDTPGREGKLGVEGMTDEILLSAFRAAGITANHTEKPAGASLPITKTDFFLDGLSGRPNSAALRKGLTRRLDLPERLSAGRLLQVLNILLTKDEYKALIKEISSRD